MGTYHWICLDGYGHEMGCSTVGKWGAVGRGLGKKTRMFCCDVEKNKTKKNIHFKTYQYLIYFSGNNFILCPDFVTSGEKKMGGKKKKK